ncbi:MAG: phosphotransferase [Phycisphaerae bacterium]
MRARKRATFGAEELAVALSHYDLGIIESITDFPRGSRRSPKAGIVCEKGKFLLKRRAVDKARADRVRFAHAVQKHLADNGFPAPKLIPTRVQGHEALQLGESIYELFEFVPGQPFRQRPEESREAGVVLARFHEATEGFVPPPNAPHGSFHDVPGVRTGLCTIDSTLSSHDSFTGNEAELATLVQYLLSVYDDAAAAVNAIDLTNWPERVVHSDWHPGNLLYKGDQVVAVIDYETVRLSRRIVDVSNAVLQFSITAGGDPASWPEHVDEERFAAFLSGYESLCPLSEQERACIIDLMIEALIAECVPPITETGSVGRWSGYRVLQMVRRKVGWMKSNADRLVPVRSDESA